MAGRKIETPEDHKGGTFSAFAGSAKGADRQNMRLRRTSHQPNMRDDRTGNAGAVSMRPFLAAKRIERRDRDARELGMPEIDTGVDHGDRRVRPFGDRMRFPQSQFQTRI